MKALKLLSKLLYSSSLNASLTRYIILFTKCILVASHIHAWWGQIGLVCLKLPTKPTSYNILSIVATLFLQLIVNLSWGGDRTNFFTEFKPIAVTVSVLFGYQHASTQALKRFRIEVSNFPSQISEQCDAISMHFTL